MDILAVTRSYEAWLGEYTSLVRYQISTKHQLMVRDPMRFLRGTFFPLEPALAGGVPAIG